MKVVVTNPRSKLKGQVLEAEAFVQDGSGGVLVILTHPKSSSFFMEKLPYVELAKKPAKPKSSSPAKETESKEAGE